MYPGPSGKSSSNFLAYLRTNPSCNHTSSKVRNMGVALTFPHTWVMAVSLFHDWEALPKQGHVPFMILKAWGVVRAYCDSQGARGGGLSVPSLGGAAQTMARASPDPQGINTIYLPKTVLALLQNPRSHKPLVKWDGSGTTLLVADTGVTDQVLPDNLAFI